jgi:hypothetical protein
VSAPTDIYKKTEEYLEAVLSMRSVPRLYNEAKSSVRVEAESNTSTVTLRVVGGDEKGSLRYETAKYVRDPQWTKTRERLRWQGPVAHTKDRPVLWSERAPQENKIVIVKE